MFFSLFSGNSVSFSLAFGCAFVVMLAMGKLFIPKFKKLQHRGQPVRSDGIAAHISEKSGTPTMGGIFIILATLISSILFMDMNSLISWIPLIAMVGFGAIGFFDDFNKIKHGNSYSGLSSFGRLIAEGIVAMVLAFMIDGVMPAYVPPLSIIAPLGIVLPVGIFYFIWSYFVIVGSANATNLTDGLDGLLSKVFLTVMVVMVVALVGITRTGFMPNLLFLPETAALFPCFGAVMGSILGFLWFNSKPASIFMGDVGSLALGGFLGSAALLMKSEIIMAVAGFVMVIMVITSFMQIMYYKFIAPRGKAPFLMAPLHHHYEMKGLKETKITERFFIAAIIFAGIAIALLKL